MMDRNERRFWVVPSFFVCVYSSSSWFLPLSV